MALTVESCAAYLVSYIKPTMKILDIGCGAGTLTCDFARLVPQGSVVGLDQGKDVIIGAREQAASKGVINVSFAVGNVLCLDFSDGEFDVVHAHRVLPYVDGSAAFKEMRRVAKPGGVVAVRDVMHTVFWPPTEEVEESMSISSRIAEDQGRSSNAGAKYRQFSREAGFLERDTLIKASAWCYSTKSRLESYCGRSLRRPAEQADRV
jgi:ubiquinone/menaquinone biosynthesis C-methylase UbiE